MVGANVVAPAGEAVREGVITVSVDVVTSESELVDLVLGSYRDVNRAWMRFGWSHLAQAEIVPAVVDDADFRYVDHVASLIALAWVAESFVQIVGGDWELDEFLVPDVVKAGDVDRPWFSEIELGRYCEREQIFVEWHPETSFSLMEAAIADRVPVVKAALVKQVGETVLFVSLVQLSRGQFDLAQDARGRWEDFSSDLVDEVVNGELQVDRLRAWEWLTTT